LRPRGLFHGRLLLQTRRDELVEQVPPDGTARLAALDFLFPIPDHPVHVRFELFHRCGDVSQSAITKEKVEHGDFRTEASHRLTS
jgi:hypothetical protein